MDVNNFCAEFDNLTISDKEKILRYVFTFSDVVIEEMYKSDLLNHAPFCDLFDSKDHFAACYKKDPFNFSVFKVISGYDDYDAPYSKIRSNCYWSDLIDYKALKNILSNEQLNIFNEYYCVNDTINELQNCIEDSLVLTDQQTDNILKLICKSVTEHISLEDSVLSDAYNVVVNKNYNQNIRTNELNFMHKVNNSLPNSYLNDVLVTLNLVESNQLVFTDEDSVNKHTTYQKSFKR